MILIEHGFKNKWQDLTALFNGVSTMDDLVNNIEEQSLVDPLHYGITEEKGINKYRGDSFEFFVEMFIKIFSSHTPHEKIKLYEYHPIPSNEDNGCDGIGLNILNEKCVVQIKFRNDPTYLLEGNKDHLTNMTNEAQFLGVVYNLNDEKNYRHFVFTTGEGLNHNTDNTTFKNKVYCFGIKKFRKMVDNNIPFWNKCREIVRELDPRLQQVV